MEYQILASGSKGNMTYIRTKQCQFFIDAGLSYKELKNRLDNLEGPIAGIFITHEHGDHVSGLVVIAKKLKAPIYMSKETYNGLLERYKDTFSELDIRLIEANSKYTIKDTQIFTLKLSHDTQSCLGFIFASEKQSLAYITDTGFLPVPYLELLKKVNHLIIEANHDISLLNDSDRPWSVKQRTLSVEGHMSNYICGQIVNTLMQDGILSHITLAHLSEECNTEELAVDTVLAAIQTARIPVIKVARQNEAGEKMIINNEH